MRYWIISFVLATICIGQFGCVSKLSTLESLTFKGHFAEAAIEALNSKESAVQLSILVLENAALSSEHMYLALERLYASGKTGKDSIKRLSSRLDETGRAASLLLRRINSVPLKKAEQCFKEPNPEVRKLCAYLFHRRLTEDVLMQMVMDIDPTVRLWALKGLANLSTKPERASVFVDVLKRDPSAKVRSEAAGLGLLLGDDALLLLKDRVTDNNLGIQTAAISSIAKLNTDDALNLLAEITRQPIDEISLHAAAELSAKGYPIGRQTLLAGLKNDNSTIRVSSLYLLSRAGFKDYIELTSELLNDKAPEVVLAAANLLRNEYSYREEILAALQKISDKQTSVSKSALDLLAVLGDIKAIQELKSFLDKAKEVDEKELILRLSRLSSKETVEFLLESFTKLLGDDREAVRVQAAITIIFSMPKI